MSTLKVNAIRGTGASSDAISVNSTDGTCTAKITNQPPGNRNKIINGAMAVSQRGTSFAAANNVYTLDRFRIAGSHDGAVTVTQSSTSPDGFANSLKIDVTTADTSIAASQYLMLQHKLEAQNLQDLAFGTSAAKTITVSFWVRSNVTGTYTFDIQQTDNSYKHVSQTYTINSADTWEKKTFTFAGDTSGVINNDNGNGLDVAWNVTAGSTYTTGTARSTWTTYAAADFAPGQTVNLLSSTSNEWYITGVQVEVGDVVTDFEHRSFGDELRRCQRYFNMHADGTATSTIGLAGSDGTYVFPVITFPVTMRAAPSLYSVTGSNYFTLKGPATAGFQVIAANVTSIHTMEIVGTVSATSGQCFMIRTDNSAARLGFSAEL